MGATARVDIKFVKPELLGQYSLSANDGASGWNETDAGAP